MTKQHFSLIPFPNSNIPAIQITGHVSRQNGVLNIQYALTGETVKIYLPEKSIPPRRRDDLWRSTCFEFFLAFPADPQYWEFNLSPSGDWNVYHMDAYRRIGLREETSIQQLQFELKNEPSILSLSANIDLRALISEPQSLQVGISTVVESVDRHETYWALTHVHSRPDFHMRDSFSMNL